MSATPTTSPTTCGPRLLRTIGRDPTSSRLQSRRRRRNHYRRIAPRGHPSWPPHGVVASKQAAVCTARVSKSIARQRNAISSGNDHSALLKLGIQGVNSPRVWIGCAGFTISGVTNSSAIYARTDASGDVTKLASQNPGGSGEHVVWRHNSRSRRRSTVTTRQPSHDCQVAGRSASAPACCRVPPAGFRAVTSWMRRASFTFCFSSSLSLSA